MWSLEALDEVACAARATLGASWSCPAWCADVWTAPSQPGLGGRAHRGSVLIHIRGVFPGVGHVEARRAAALGYPLISATRGVHVGALDATPPVEAIGMAATKIRQPPL